MSPEQLEGEPVDYRADVFALGIMLYEFAAKRHPFLGKTPGSTISNILKEEPPEISRSVQSVPAELDRVIRKSIRKRPAERYQSVQDLVVDLQVIRAGNRAGGPVATDADFALPPKASWVMFLLTQCGYLALYGAALYHAEAIGRILARDFLLPEATSLAVVLVLAMCGIATRLYLLSAVGWKHPNAANQFKRLFPAILIQDAIWSAAPLLLWRSLGYGVALGCVALMAYVPFAQRTLIRSVYSRSRLGSS